jgi:hypothetical protein
MSGELFIVSRVARQMIIEFGESAPAAARINMEECRIEGDIEGIQNWETVLEVLLRLHPATVSSIHSKR